MQLFTVGLGTVPQMRQMKGSSEDPAKVTRAHGAPKGLPPEIKLKDLGKQRFCEAKWLGRETLPSDGQSPPRSLQEM